MVAHGLNSDSVSRSMLASVQSHQLAVAGINGRDVPYKFYSSIASMLLTAPSDILQFIQRLSERKTSCRSYFARAAWQRCPANRELTPTTRSGEAPRSPACAIPPHWWCLRIHRCCLACGAANLFPKRKQPPYNDAT
jgi:hypothetical protein